jgi:hypothetical protein
MEPSALVSCLESLFNTATPHPPWGGSLSEPQHRPRAGSTPPMTLTMAKQAQRLCQSESRSSGAARGDYEALVPFKQHWILLVAAWKTASPRGVGRPQGLFNVSMRRHTCLPQSSHPTRPGKKSDDKNHCTMAAFERSFSWRHLH